MKEPRKSIAVAGRFMTKWLKVWGIVIVVDRDRARASLSALEAERGGVPGIVILFCPVAVSSKRLSVAS